MRCGFIGCLLVAALGCGGDDSTGSDTFDAVPEDAAEAMFDDGAAEDASEATFDDGVAEDAAEAAEDGGGLCGPGWHPTSCGDCSGGSAGASCHQECTGTACGDGRTYRAECDGTSGTCNCLIDGAVVCTCTSAYPIETLGCEPEEWGGANCCWNVG